MGRGAGGVRDAEGRRDAATDAELIEHVRERLARFKAPKRVMFGPLPKTSTGKVQKNDAARPTSEGLIMAVDFTLSPDLLALQARIRSFIADEVIPLEARCPPHAARARPRSCAAELIEKARAAGLLSPQCRREYGGLALSHVGRAVAFEEAGYSPLGPIALNVFAPDEGNMHLLEAVATPAQKERWLRPLASAARSVRASA